MNIENIQTFCRTLQGVKEDIKWEHDLVFSVGDKMFCVVGLDQEPITASFKVTDDEYEELSNVPGFKPAPYLARHKWVFIDDINRINKSEWQRYLEQSYKLVSEKLPKKIRKELGIG